jgi:hypothetical protein
MNLKELILKSSDSKLEAVEVPEWSATVYLKPLTVETRAELFKKIDGAEKATVPTWLVLYTLCNESGELVFSPEDYGLLAGKSAVVIDRLMKKACDMNGIGPDAIDEAKKN